MQPSRVHISILPLRFSERENTRENLADSFFPKHTLKNTPEWRFTRKGSTLQPDDDDDDDNESAAVVVVSSVVVVGGGREEWCDTYLLGRHNLRVGANQISLPRL